MLPASFRKAYPDRRVNNIYFDTLLLNAYTENVDGVPERKKYRLRWYGERFDFLENPVFEIKIKKNLLGTKVSHKLSDFPFSDFSSVCQKLEADQLKPSLFRPVLFNSYLRSYYVSFDGRFRITIDWELSFGQFDLQKVFFNRKDLPAKVLELKYDTRFSKEADGIMQHLPFRLSKNSKYGIGLELVMD